MAHDPSKQLLALARNDISHKHVVGKVFEVNSFVFLEFSS